MGRFEDLNSMGMSTAGEGSTEPNRYFRISENADESPQVHQKNPCERKDFIVLWNSDDHIHQYCKGDYDMTYVDNAPVSANALADLRQSVGWNRMESCYSSSLMTSYYHIAVYEDDVLIAFIDCVSNSVTDAYIQDLIVHPNYQGRGIGTELMNRMIAFLKSRHIFMISVIFEDSLRSFYKRFGFTEMLSGQLQTFNCE